MVITAEDEKRYNLKPLPEVEQLTPEESKARQEKYAQDRQREQELHPSPDRTGLVMLGELRLMPYRERIKLASPEQLESHPELSRKPKIYIASKARHRPRWRDLRDNRGYDIISHWIDTPDEYSDDPTGLDYDKLWRTCIQDVKDCDTLVLYVETDEHLKGALVELGIALALGKDIIVTGDLGDNGTWHHMSKVEVSEKTMEDVLAYIYYG